MSDHKLLSITEAAHLLGCTVDGIRRYVLEDGTLAALRVCPRGYKSPFELRGLRLYVVNESGGVIDPSTGAAAGNLRFEQCEVIRHKAKAGVLAKETVPERRTRYLAAFESEEKTSGVHGALTRLALHLNVDRSNLKKDIDKARAARTPQIRAGSGWNSQLVTDGKRTA